MSLSCKQIKQLVEHVESRNIGRVEVALSKQTIVMQARAQPVGRVPVTPASDCAPPPYRQAPTPCSSVEVRSEHVGRLYACPNLGPLPAKVKKGQRLGYLRALGLQRDIRSPVAGTVMEQPTLESHPVEWGQLLWVVAPER